MTRKDFAAIAQILGTNMASRKLTQDLMTYFSEVNPRFDEERFAKAVQQHHNNDLWQGMI